MAVPNKDPEKLDADIDFKEGLYDGAPESVSKLNCCVPSVLELANIKGR